MYLLSEAATVDLEFHGLLYAARHGGGEAGTQRAGSWRQGRDAAGRRLGDGRQLRAVGRPGHLPWPALVGWSVVLRQV